MRSAVAALFLLFHVAAFADGGAMLLEHRLNFARIEPLNTDFRVDGLYTLHETLHNETGVAWTKLRIEIVRDLGFNLPTAPIEPKDAINFMASEPLPVWRPTIEARINGHYLGLPGGGWQLHRNPSATVLDLEFDEIPVAPGQQLALRLRVQSQSDAINWRLRYTPQAPTLLKTQP